MKEQDKVTVVATDENLYFLVYFCGDELPTAMFDNYENAVEYCRFFTQNWMDKEIRTANLWNMAGPLFRDRTQFYTRMTVKNPEDEGLI